MNTYFDNSSTSFPKPPQVAAAITHYLNHIGGTYGRAAYNRVMQASAETEACRDLVAQIIGTTLSDNIGFTLNATASLNLLIQGLCKPGDHVLTSPMEHNAVARPLHALCQQGIITRDMLEADHDGRVIAHKIAEKITPHTRLVIINHMSNVNGVIQPLEAIKKAIGNIPLLVDATQSAGKISIQADARHLDMVALTGHKSLLGPTGIGAFFVRNHSLVEPLVYGGTGSKSEMLEMPGFMPDKYEAGTQNIAGIFGLKAAIEHQPIPCHTPHDFLSLLAETEKLTSVTVIKAQNSNHQGELFSITHKQYDTGTLADILYRKGGIETRAGLHCAPLAHRHLGTFPDGTVRISLSPYHTPDDLKHLLRILQEID